MNTRLHLALMLVVGVLAPSARAQNAPTRQELAVYAGLHEAAAKGDVAEIERLIQDGERPNLQDSKSRTPLHVAAYMKQHAAARALIRLGANPNALEIERYDIVTIAAASNDIEMLKLALEGGASARNITSRYDGTALIAAAHLGHAEAVKILTAAKAPLAFGRLLVALDFHLGRFVELAVIGQPADPDSGRFLDVLRQRFLPNRLVAVAPGAGAIPLLADRRALNGKATAYLCEGFVCQAPTTDPNELARQLDAFIAKPVVS